VTAELLVRCSITSLLAPDAGFGKGFVRGSGNGRLPLPLGSGRGSGDHVSQKLPMTSAQSGEPDLGEIKSVMGV